MFIPNTVVAKKVRLLRERSTLAGKFTAGHEFTVESVGARGMDLIDADGNRMMECGLMVEGIDYEFI